MTGVLPGEMIGGYTIGAWSLERIGVAVMLGCVGWRCEQPDRRRGPLSPGVNRITLVAGDGTGQTGFASTTVIVNPVSLSFLHVKIPSQTSPAARRLRLRVRSALSAVVTIGGHAYALQARRRRLLTLAINPGSTPLLLRFTIDAHGIRIPFAARVARD
jgi:hypothetical protein